MRPSQERAWHYIKRNETTRQPRRHIFIDTEARIRKEGATHEQEWRLGVAIYASGAKGRRYTTEARDYDKADALWADVSAFSRAETRTVLWAHNLGYDARISRMFTILPQLGWNLTGHAISSQSTWFEWKRDKATLLMCDSTSVFPTTIAQMGKWFGFTKPEIALDAGTDADWLNRCRVDCNILATAVLAYLDWLETEDMGNWQMTGNGQSWAAFRHKFLTHNMCVHDDEEALKAERRAMWTGRCEAYWLGEWRNEQLYEFDFTTAYARIARDSALPVKLLGKLPDGYDWNRILSSEKSALLAQVRVTTREPVVPAEHGGRILWPVGTFETILWDVEINALLNVGARIEYLQGWAYRKAPALAAWGTWILDQLGSDDKDVSAWQKSILKHWSRALIGRMAMTYRQWEEYATMPGSDVKSGAFYDRDTGEEFDYMQIGKTLWRDAGRVEWSESMPMVTGYVQAIARVQLWNILKEMPERSVLYVDTDSLFVTRQHVETMGDIANRISGGSLRLKRVWDGFSIYGPRQIVTGPQTRVSGLPKRAIRVAKREFEGETWDTLRGALKRGNLGTVITRERRWHIDGVDHRRKGRGFGWNEPVSLGIGSGEGIQADDVSPPTQRNARKADENGKGGAVERPKTLRREKKKGGNGRKRARQEIG